MRAPGKARLHLAIRGAVQGVGFRPFVFRLAKELGLAGWVQNSPRGVTIELEGTRADLETALLRVEREKPPASFIQSLEPRWLAPRGYGEFEIRASDPSGPKTAILLPDIATCPECLREILDPANRRHEYPFTNCTLCGPRFSIIHGLPYDRENTSMRRFKMCEQCQAEYENPANRRFHAQPNACPNCGPHLQLWDASGQVLASRRDALEAAAAALRNEKIVAVKGIGGFHLMVIAGRDSAVSRLREAKHREAKPFALMFPSLGSVEEHCEVSPLEARLLRSPEAPITLLRRKPGDEGVSRQVAPGNPYLGVMLPYSPLHHLLLRAIGRPVVATSGNAADEPICIDETEALQRLSGMVDLLLVHDRPIVRHVDDSIARVMAGRELVLRRARGFAPLPVAIGRAKASDSAGSGDVGGRSLATAPVLAVGGHLKNTIALCKGSEAFISQHLGDLETQPAYDAFQRVIQDFERIYEAAPQVVAADAHPEYLSTQYAVGRVRSAAGQPPVRLVQVQHHLAHVLSCMAENEIAPPLMGVSWDGTGYGLDGTIWGGEFFMVTEDAWQRAAHFRTFPLPGGSKAIQEPRRSALGALYEMLGEHALGGIDSLLPGVFRGEELTGLGSMLKRGLNCPRTSSVGRLFDAVASLCGLAHYTRYEGEAAMQLEFALEPTRTEEAYPLARENRTPFWEADECWWSGDTSVEDSPALVIDWEPALESVLDDRRRGVGAHVVAARFHNYLANLIAAVARHFSIEQVALSGGCFQNKYLTEHSLAALERAGFRPFFHQRVPPNDGGISLGQVVAAYREKM